MVSGAWPAVFSWYVGKSDFSSVRVFTYSRLHWTSNFLQVTRNTRSCLTGRIKGSLPGRSKFEVHVSKEVLHAHDIGEDPVLIVL